MKSNTKSFVFNFVDAASVSTIVPDSPHKIFIGGLPNYLNEDQVYKPYFLILCTVLK